MTGPWPFKDGKKTAVFTSKAILNGSDWIHYVTHDAEDGAWQFHPYSGLTPEHDAVVVSLDSIADMDDAILALADLPRGWHAWRESRSATWNRGPKSA